jgi:hypothetical protein
MLSHAVMSVVQVFPSSWYWVWLVSLLRVGLPSVMMWGDRDEDRCCGLSKIEMVETVGFCQVMWIVMLELAKDRVLGVDTPRQQLSPRVWYGMTCLLIRDVVGCVLLGWVRNWCSYSSRFTQCKRGHGTAAGIVTHPDLPWETSAMLWYCILA